MKLIVIQDWCSLLATVFFFFAFSLTGALILMQLQMNRRDSWLPCIIGQTNYLVLCYLRKQRELKRAHLCCRLAWSPVLHLYLPWARGNADSPEVCLQRNNDPVKKLFVASFTTEPSWNKKFVHHVWLRIDIKVLKCNCACVHFDWSFRSRSDLTTSVVMEIIYQLYVRRTPSARKPYNYLQKDIWIFWTLLMSWKAVMNLCD